MANKLVIKKFEDNLQNWVKIGTGTSSYSYASGKATIVCDNTQDIQYRNATQISGDFWEINVSFKSTSAATPYTRIFFNIQDKDNGYLFQCDTGTIANVYKKVSGTYTLISGTPWSFIYDARSFINIKIRKILNKYYFWANGTYLGTVTDSTFSSGYASAYFYSDTCVVSSFTINWINSEVDITSYITNAVYQDKGKSSLTKLSVDCIYTIARDGLSPVFDNEVMWYYDTVPVFGGVVNKPETGDGLNSYTCYSYGDELIDRYVNEVLENMSPEAILQFVIHKYSSLVCTSAAITGVTITKIKFKQQTVAEVIKTLTKLTGWVFYTTPYKEAIFQPPGYVISGVSYSVKNNAAEKPAWDYNQDNVINTVTVVGDKIVFSNINSPDTFTATASQTDFTLVHNPIGNISVTDNGTLVAPEVIGATVTGDYYIDVDKKLLKFKTGRTVGHTIICKYDYQIDIKVYVTSASNNEKVREVILTNRSIKNHTDARAYGQNYLSFKDTPQTGTIFKKLDYNTALNTSSVINIVDEYESPALNKNFAINEIKYSFSSNTVEYKIGVEDFSIFEWQNEIMDRLKSLENQSTSEDLLQYYNYDSYSIPIVVQCRDYAFWRDYYDSARFGISTFGGSKFGDRRLGDVFSSYASGNYTLTTNWTLTGSVVVTSLRLQIPAAASALFINGSTYVSDNGKIQLSWNHKASGSLKMYFRRTDDNNSYILQIDNAAVYLKKIVSGSETTLISQTGLSWTGDKILNVRFSDRYIKIYSPSGDVELDIEDTTYTNGSIKLSAVTLAQEVIYIKIYEEC